MLGEENPGVAATENLFQDFLSTVSSGDSGAAALDSIAELEQMVGAESFLFHPSSFEPGDDHGF
jgi:hypothetical protein